jgi:hypothetical protein
MVYPIERAPEPATPQPAVVQERTAAQKPAAVQQPAAIQEFPPENPAPLAAPRNLRPAAGFRLSEEQIIRDRQIIFSWDAVSEAAEYSFTLQYSTPEGNREVLRRTLRSTSFTLTDLGVLDAGAFLWQVQAENARTGRKSAAAESRFTVDIGEVQATQGQDTGVLFGNQ